MNKAVNHSPLVIEKWNEPIKKSPILYLIFAPQRICNQISELDCA